MMVNAPPSILPGHITYVDRPMFVNLFGGGPAPYFWLGKDAEGLGSRVVMMVPSASPAKWWKPTSPTDG